MSSRQRLGPSATSAIGMAAAETFIAEKEEGFLLDHRAAERPAKFIEIEFGVAQAIKGRRRIIEGLVVFVGPIRFT